MKYHSTRDLNKIKYESSLVIKQGLASDGGLFVPETIPTLSLDEISEYTSLSYPELAATILSKYLTNYSFEELLEDCKKAYSFEAFGEDACPIKCLNTNTYSLELWHGPTCAFKDMALQIMPRLLSRALIKTNEENDALILVATSGDTGKAALEGYKNIDRIKIAVFYPQDGVSVVQKLQMATQDGDNVNVCAIKGNFDDIQSSVKNIFSNETFSNELNNLGYSLSSANSINFGRLAPQIVYYFKAYCDLLKQNKISLGESINVCVPTGNFGNILAAYFAKLMGLPINKLICASNSNNILTDFLNTGIYDRNRDFHLTISPSMDILISSNLERLLYFVAGSEKTSEWMKSLKDVGFYEIDEKTKEEINKTFIGYCANECDTRNTIKNIYNNYSYLIDTHTAVGFSALHQYREATNDNTVSVVASTANPYKFAKDVYNSLFDLESLADLSSLSALCKKTGEPIPQPLANLTNKKINFNSSATTEEMYEVIYNFIKN